MLKYIQQNDVILGLCMEYDILATDKANFFDNIDIYEETQYVNFENFESYIFKSNKLNDIPKKYPKS